MLFLLPYQVAGPTRMKVMWREYGMDLVAKH